MRADVKVLVLATASVVRALVDPKPEHIRILDRERNLILVHSFTPTSEAVERVFHGPRSQELSRSGRSGFRSRNVIVSFPPTPCPACGGHRPGRQPPPIESTGGLDSLREIGLDVARRQQEVANELARRDTARRTEEDRRSSLFRSALDQFQSISTALRDAILSAAPAATLVAPPLHLANWHAWTISLGDGLLMLVNPEAISFNFEQPRVRDPDWTIGADTPFDTIACCFLVVGGRSSDRTYLGRSHSLWFCDAQSHGRYEWYETAFAPTSRRYSESHNLFIFYHDDADRVGIYAPGPGVPGQSGISSALRGEPSGIEVVWPFTMLTASRLHEFVERWAGWFAAAAHSRLQLPSRLPEHDPTGTWRTDGL